MKYYRAANDAQYETWLEGKWVEVEVDEQDTKRLEQIIKDNARVIQAGEKGWAYAPAFSLKTFYGKTPREAIDAAMRKETNGTKTRT